MRAGIHKALGWLALAVPAVLGPLIGLMTDVQRVSIWSMLNGSIWWWVLVCGIALAWLMAWALTRPLPDAASEAHFEDAPAPRGHGYSASDDATITIIGGVSEGNGGSGVFAEGGARVVARGLEVRNNGRR